MSDKRALVTGGAGFIGSHLVVELLQQGYRVRVLEDFSSGRRPNLPEADYELIEGDLRDPHAVEAALRDVNCVFHQAAMVSVPASVEEPRSCYEVNLLGSVQLLRMASQAGVDRVILASSAAVYGDTPNRVAEDSPKAPISPYAASKLAMEEAALMFNSVYGLPIVCLRYFNVYGPRQRPDSPYSAVIPAFVQALLAGHPPVILGDGQQRRDLVFIDDIVRANLLAAEREQAVGGIFNIGSGKSITVNELARILQTIVQTELVPINRPPREGDIRFSEADISGAAQALGYRPRTSIAKGLESTVEWFVQERVRLQA